jgi:hypothetical protein
VNLAAALCRSRTFANPAAFDRYEAGGGGGGCSCSVNFFLSRGNSRNSSSFVCFFRLEKLGV